MYRDLLNTSRWLTLRGRKPFFSARIEIEGYLVNKSESRRSNKKEIFRFDLLISS